MHRQTPQHHMWSISASQLPYHRALHSNIAGYSRSHFSLLSEATHSEVQLHVVIIRTRVRVRVWLQVDCGRWASNPGTLHETILPSLSQIRFCSNCLSGYFLVGGYYIFYTIRFNSILYYYVVLYYTML